MKKETTNIDGKGTGVNAAEASNELNKAQTINVRYSDLELKEFKELILAKLSETKTDYDLLKGTLARQHDNGTDDTSPTFKLTDDAQDIFTMEEIAQLAIRQQKYIEQLRNALVRIENKTYGICKISGKLISKQRLKSVPHTTMSIEAKLESICPN